MKALNAAVLALAMMGPAKADGPPATVESEFGILNPQDTGKEMIRRKIEMGVIDSITCSLGINVTKTHDHALARKLVKRCAEAGYAKAMTYMSQLENNGLGGDYNPDAAAKWDKRAADAGDPVGRFNHGLNLMRGHGTAQDEAAGRAFVDQAAKDGLAIARRLQGADYDLDAVTPDADNWRYGPMF
ncbi:MAG: sel1 repeat family protein [Pseudomonadota bacterium]